MTIALALATRISIDGDGSEALDLLVLPQSKRDAIRARCRSLGLQPGDVGRCVDLALQCARQCLRAPVPFGAVVERIDGRGGREIVIGSKPSGFRERIFSSLRTAMRRDRELPGWDEPLVWTADPSSSRPGISQSRLSDWKVVDKKA